jgi:N-acylglucosamine-6-phosphate 2-epimerase
MGDHDPPGYHFALTGTPNEAWSATIRNGLKAYNDAESPYFAAARQPETGAAPLEIYVTDAAGTLVGGLLAYTVWGWLYIDILWLAEAARGHAVGTRLRALAEAEARRRGCTHAHLRTFSFQARGFYEKCGYRVIGALEGYPPGGTFYWLRKDFG